MYYIVYSILYLVSLLPLKLLYVISDFAALILYRVKKYRLAVVRNNLKQVFPQMSSEERSMLEKKFYRNFTDNFIEVLKLISAGPKFILKHCNGDVSALDELHRRGRRCQILLSHNFNWELAWHATTLKAKQPMLGVYMPIRNKIFSRLFFKLRSKTGGGLIKATDVKNEMIPYRDLPYALGLVADQNPGDPSKAIWINYFGRPTPFVTGPERAARRENNAVVFAWFSKIRRGYYQMHFELAVDEPRKLEENELTLMYARFLEDVIKKSPDTYLWTHRRFKHDWKEGFSRVLSI